MAARSACGAPVICSPLLHTTQVHHEEASIELASFGVPSHLTHIYAHHLEDMWEAPESLHSLEAQLREAASKARCGGAAAARGPAACARGMSGGCASASLATQCRQPPHGARAAQCTARLTRRRPARASAHLTRAEAEALAATEPVAAAEQRLEANVADAEAATAASTAAALEEEVRGGGVAQACWPFGCVLPRAQPCTAL